MINFWILLFFVFLFLIWIRFVETNNIQLERVTLSFENFPQKELTAVHLTDFHSFGYGDKERKVVKMVEKIDPDFIFITGDFISWRTDREGIKECAVFWEDLTRGREGRVFAVWGNHKHKSLRPEMVEREAARSGIRVLVNENIKVDWGGSSIYLVGVDDPRLRYDRVEKAMRGVDGGKPVILLAHSPEIFRKVKYYHPNLILVGHTHGCQVKIPVLCDWVLPLAYDKRFKQGLFQEDGVLMYVNRGVGESFLPIRFNCPPEITIVKFKSK